jgi:hypothetical protein
VANSNSECYQSRITVNSSFLLIAATYSFRYVMTRWNKLSPEESKQYEYIPEGDYDFDTKALRLVARSGGKFVFRQLFRAE